MSETAAKRQNNRLDLVAYHKLIEYLKDKNSRNDLDGKSFTIAASVATQDLGFTVVPSHVRTAAEAGGLAWPRPGKGHGNLSTKALAHLLADLYQVLNDQLDFPVEIPPELLHFVDEEDS